MRVFSVLPVLLALGCVADKSCSYDESGSLFQAAVSTSGDLVKDGNAVAVDDDWHFDGLKNLTAGLKDILGSFNAEKLQDQLAKLTEAKSFEDVASKLSAFADEFSKNLQQTLTKTDQQLKVLREKAKSTTSAAKAKAVAEITKQITKVGRVAMNIAETVIAKIEEAQIAVTGTLKKVKSAKVADHLAALQTKLDNQLRAMLGLVDQLKKAMNREKFFALVETGHVKLTDAKGPSAAEAEEEVVSALQKSNEALDASKTYVLFVNNTLNQAEVKALILTKTMAEDVSGKADKTTEKVTDELLGLVDNVQKMLKGEYDLSQAKVDLKSGSHEVSALSTLLVALSCLALADRK